jgi:hypothetical protein
MQKDNEPKEHDARAKHANIYHSSHHGTAGNNSGKKLREEYHHPCNAPDKENANERGFARVILKCKRSDNRKDEDHYTSRKKYRAT